MNDCTVARELAGSLPPSKELVADKAYDTNALRAFLKSRKTRAVIPPSSQRNIQYRYDKQLYRQRNVIERSFCRLKDFRRIAMRYDRRVDVFFAALCFVTAVIWWI